MMTMMENEFSDEDLQYIATYELGKPLYIYRLKASHIRFLRRGGLSIFLIGIIALILAIIVDLDDGRNLLSFDGFVSLLGGLYALFQGGVFYRIMALRAQSTRIIVCEDGLLQIIKMIKTNHAKVVPWSNILTIKKAIIGQDYTVTYHYDKHFDYLTLSSSYQNLNELVTLITEYSEKFPYKEMERMDVRSVFAQPQAGVKYRCPCCSYKTLNERGSCNVCPVCFWEDDGQDDVDADTNRLLSPNHMSLALGRENYQKFGAT